MQPEIVNEPGKAVCTKMSRQASPVSSRECPDISEGNPFRSHNLGTDRLSKHASFYQPRKSAYRQGEPVHMPRSPFPRVSIPVMSLQRPSSKRHHSEEVSKGLDSAPSDDENDADYVDDALKRVDSDDNSSVSQRVLKQTLPESLLPRIEAFPVEGILNLRISGPNVRFHSLQLDMSRARVLPSVEPDLQQQTGATKRPRYSSEQDDFLIDLRAKDFEWNEIEDLYARRFLPRKMASLQGRYNRLMNNHKKRRL